MKKELEKNDIKRYVTARIKETRKQTAKERDEYWQNKINKIFADLDKLNVFPLQHNENEVTMLGIPKYDLIELKKKYLKENEKKK